jgi:hypothetical protein
VRTRKTASHAVTAEGKLAELMERRKKARQVKTKTAGIVADLEKYSVFASR